MDTYPVLHERLQTARQVLQNAKDDVHNLERECSAAEVEFKKSLPVTHDEPCNVGVLPDGTVVVHVWIDTIRLGEEQNRIFVLEPERLHWDGLPVDEECGEDECDDLFADLI